MENLALAAHFLPDKYHGRPKEKGLLTTYDHLTIHALDLRETEITVTQASAQSLVANLARRFESLITIYLLNFNRLLLKYCELSRRGIKGEFSLEIFRIRNAAIAQIHFEAHCRLHFVNLASGLK